MKLKHEEKLNSRIASRVPLDASRKIFYSSYDKDCLQIEGKAFSDVKREDLPAHNKQALILLMVSYPSLLPSQYLSIIPDSDLKDILFNAAALGYSITLMALKKEHPFAIKTMSKTDRFLAFQQAASNGHLNILKWLTDPTYGESLNRLLEMDELLKIDNLLKLIKKNDYSAVKKAASNGHLDTFSWLIKNAPNPSDMFMEDKYDAFSKAAKNAAKNGHLDILIELQNQVPDNFLHIIQIDNYATFTQAASNGHLNILIWLKDQAPFKLKSMIKASDYSAFKAALQNYDKNPSSNNEATINWLLNQPVCLAYAEQHVQEYSLFVNPFIDSTLKTLSQQHDALLNINPNGVFNLSDPDQITVCFYMIKNLIRRNDREHDDDILFLLNIPSIKALAHQGNPSNELLILALNTSNPTAASLLLSIEAVRTIAAQNNFYRAEQQNGIDLRQLAQDRESSMTALSQGEAKRLESAIKRYQPMIEQRGNATIMQTLKESLIAHYNKTAASITSGEKWIELPLTYEAFQKLKLDPDEKKAALEAYYQHPAHTAWRYLSKPNSWMHEQASYVYINEDRTERWSTFEEYQPLIALMYLAVIDESMQPEEGHTLESRILHFINELALIGRSHNWDKSRVRNGQAEEYDDLEGDRPSCYSGVKRRLFQSVISHPLFRSLNDELIEAEIKQFAFTHFKSILTENNQQQVKQILDEIFNDLDEDNIEQLRCFDISPKQEEKFIQCLTDKYGAQFNDFVPQVRHELALSPENKESRFRYHLLKLMGLTQFYSYLESICSAQTNAIIPEKQTMEVNKESIIIQEPAVDLSIESLKNKINLALLGKSDLSNEGNGIIFVQPNKNSYLGWMKEHTNGTRGITRFSHWNHGDSGMQRAINLLKITNDPLSTVENIKEAVKQSYKESSCSQHSLSRYLEAQLSDTDFAQLEALEDDVFREIKNKRVLGS